MKTTKFKLKLHWQILIAFIFAIIYGYYLPDQVNYISWLGPLFLRALKMVIIPLIFSSIVSGVTSMGTGKDLGRLTVKTLSYYLLTSLFAILTGLILVNIIQPGLGTDLGLAQHVKAQTLENQSLGGILMRMVPDNIVSAMNKGNMLSIIFFAVIFGFFIGKIKQDHKKTLTSFFDGLFEVMMRITSFIIRFTPLGVFGIVAKQISENATHLTSLAASMATYMGTVALALSIHFFITLPLIVRFVGKAKPYAHLRNMATALLTAFSTSSSSATLPLTMDATENKSGVSNRITSFTLPLGSTINMDGTALYECVAVLFIAQAYGIHLSFTAQVVVVITALLTSIGAAGIPMAGLIMMTTILTAVHLPLEGVGLIMAVDRILDMYRTSLNVWSDSCGAVIIAKSEGDQLNV